MPLRLLLKSQVYRGKIFYKRTVATVGRQTMVERVGLKSSQNYCFIWFFYFPGVRSIMHIFYIYFRATGWRLLQANRQ